MFLLRKNSFFLLGFLTISSLIFGCTDTPRKKASVQNDKTQIKQPKQKDETIKGKRIHLVNGRYGSTIDSLAGIEIIDSTYVMFYKGREITPSDSFNINITNKIAYNDRIFTDGKFLLLKNEDITLKYAIIRWNRELIELIYLPRGNTLVYKREPEN